MCFGQCCSSKYGYGRDDDSLATHTHMSSEGRTDELTFSLLSYFLFKPSPLYVTMTLTLCNDFHYPTQMRANFAVQAFSERNDPVPVQQRPTTTSSFSVIFFFFIVSCSSCLYLQATQQSYPQEPNIPSCTRSNTQRVCFHIQYNKMLWSWLANTRTIHKARARSR